MCLEFLKIPNKNLESDIVEIEMKGAVAAPGIYYIKKGSPLSKVMSECGGIQDNGILIEDIDLNAPVYENMLIAVPMHYTLKKSVYEKK